MNHKPLASRNKEKKRRKMQNAIQFFNSMISKNDCLCKTMQLKDL